jgi:transcriptional regulator with XRE-family HTH domain
VPSRLGDVLRYWRRVRRTSQLDLASRAHTTPRYLSFVETGRSQPTRQMVLRLARALDVPLRERNGLLVAAGYAPMYREDDLSAPELDRVESALAAMLDSHDPFPAVVMDRGWNVLRANQGARRLFGGLLRPQPIPEPANVLRLMIEPGPVRRSVLNWTSVVPMLLERARREAVGGVLDGDTAALVERLCELPDVATLVADLETTAPTVPVLDVQFLFEGVKLSFFSVVSTVGAPVDVTTQELRLEAFFAHDQGTREEWVSLGSAQAHT